MHLTSHDDEFREKRDDVLRGCYEAPKSEHIVCVGEKDRHSSPRAPLHWHPDEARPAAAPRVRVHPPRHVLLGGPVRCTPRQPFRASRRKRTTATRSSSCSTSSISSIRQPWAHRPDRRHVSRHGSWLRAPPASDALHGGVAPRLRRRFRCGGRSTYRSWPFAGRWCSIAWVQQSHRSRRAGFRLSANV
jgi:hypothetical protein